MPLNWTELRDFAFSEDGYSVANANRNNKSTANGSSGNARSGDATSAAVAGVGVGVAGGAGGERGRRKTDPSDGTSRFITRSLLFRCRESAQPLGATWRRGGGGGGGAGGGGGGGARGRARRGGKRVAEEVRGVACRVGSGVEL